MTVYSTFFTDITLVAFAFIGFFVVRLYIFVRLFITFMFCRLYITLSFVSSLCCTSLLPFVSSLRCTSLLPFVSSLGCSSHFFFAHLCFLQCTSLLPFVSSLGCTSRFLLFGFASDSLLS